ncbi:MAG: hypothetical protein H0T62_08370 [Parachlamydiaceae bacterium]|nr:hypothetical protein [Parachlamydiaceae bacterium]
MSSQSIFIKYNPWKLSAANNFQKVYRFCIICGGERYSSAEWTKVIDSIGPPTICRKNPCWDALEFISGFVPRKHFIIETDLDKSRVKSAKAQEFFEEIADVVTTIRNDKVYGNKEQIPTEYYQTFSVLESYPVETRIAKIDAIYFDHMAKNNIVVGNCMTDTSDPFLKELAVYRQQSIKILASL